MKKIIIAVFGGSAMLSGLAAGYCFSQNITNYGWLCVLISMILLLILRSRLRAMRTPAEKAAKALENPAMNLAFYSELSRLIDEGKDVNSYLRECGAPENMVKSVNIGGSSEWYLHKDNQPYDEFSADIPAIDAPAPKHPYIKSSRIENETTRVITVDLERALWDWGNQHPEKRRYANSMRIAFQGVYAPAENGGNSYLDKSIDDIRAARKKTKKKPKKSKKPNAEI